MFVCRPEILILTEALAEVNIMDISGVQTNILTENKSL